jgi:hypothetical protein
MKLVLQHIGKGWRDKDDVLIHAMFQTLLNFFEEEHPEEVVEWYGEYGPKYEDDYVMDIFKELRCWFLNVYLSYYNEVPQSAIYDTIPIPNIRSEPIPGTKLCHSWFEYDNDEDREAADNGHAELSALDVEMRGQITEKAKLLVEVRGWMCV